MKEKLKKAYKETPERFHYTISSAVEEATVQQQNVKKRRSKGWRIVIAFAIIAALIPSAAFGATKLYGIFAKPAGKYAVNIGIEQNENKEYPEYVKMHITVPDGFAEVPGNEGMKYYKLSTEEPYTDGFTVLPMRLNANNPTELITHAGDYKETVISGHQAYKIIAAGEFGGWQRTFVYFGDMNVLLLIYHENVTDEEMDTFVSGISFTEGTADDFTPDYSYLFSPENEDNDGNRTEYVMDYEYIEMPLDTAMTFGEEHPTHTSKVVGVRMLDNINGLNESDFNDLYWMKDVVDENGNILPHTRNRWDYGDGINTANKLISSTEVEQKLVLIDIEYTNLLDKENNIYVPWQIQAMEKTAKNEFSRMGIEIIGSVEEIIESEYCSGEIFYLSRHGEAKKDFYQPTLEAGETTTITIGYLCDTDKLDDIYLMIEPTTSRILAPEFPTGKLYLSYVMKVQ